MNDFIKKREEKIKALWQESKEREAQRLAEKHNLLYIDLRKSPIETSALSIIPEEKAKKVNIIAFQKIGNQVKIAVLDPFNIETIETIEGVKQEGYKVVVFVATEESLNWAWKNYAFVHQRQKKISNFIDVTSAKSIEFSDLHGELLSISSEEVTSLVSLILKSAIQIDASDIHIEPQEDCALLRFRIDGVLYDIAEIEKRNIVALIRD